MFELPFWLFGILAVLNFICLDVMTKNAIPFQNMMSFAIVTFLCDDITASVIRSGDASTKLVFEGRYTYSDPILGQNISSAMIMYCLSRDSLL